MKMKINFKQDSILKSVQTLIWSNHIRVWSLFLHYYNQNSQEFGKYICTEYFPNDRNIGFDFTEL